MKNIFLLSFILTMTCADAQLWQASFGGLFYHQTGATISSYDPGSSQGTIYSQNPVDRKTSIPEASVFFYYPFYSPNDNLSFGGQAGFSFWGYYSKKNVNNIYGQSIGSTGGSPLEIGYNVPLVAMARFGALATEDNDALVGGAIGCGASLFGFNIPDEKGFMIPFTLCAEFNIKRYGIRLDLPLKKYTSIYKSYTGDIPRITTSFYSVKLIVSF